MTWEVTARQVNLRWVAVEVEVRLGRRETDEHRAIDLWGQYGLVEDAGDVEPHIANPDPFSLEDPVDAQALGRGRAEHGDGLLRRCCVQPGPLRDRRPDRRQQPEACGFDAESVGIDRRV